MDASSNLDWARADRSDISNAAIRDAIAGTLVNARHAGDVLAERLARRCVERIVTALRAKFPDYPKPDLRALVEDAAADIVLRVKAGKLTEFHQSPTGYIYVTCEHELQNRARLKKGHEKPMSQLDQQSGLQRNTTLAFVNTLASRHARPEEIVIRKEMLRALGAQVGRLSLRQRQVISRVREGLGNKDIAREIGTTEATVRSHYDHAIDQLRLW